ncbi:MAG: hypothetical protein GY811_06910 [Myxococcales bacterium]|nr:hypothetical protein [Myxococcales bacterium]
MSKSKHRARRRVKKSAHSTAYRRPTGPPQSLADLLSDMEVALPTLIFDLPVSVDEVSPNWWELQYPEGEREHPVDAAVAKIITQEDALRRQEEKVNYFIGSFQDALPEELRALWPAIREMQSAQRAIQNAVYYNIGVKDGRTMMATKIALEQVGAFVRTPEQSKLFEIAMVLRKIASNLAWESLPRNYSDDSSEKPKR